MTEREELQNERALQLRSLIEERGLTVEEIADYLSWLTGDKIHQKSVQRWIAPYDKSYSRMCPGWVIALVRAKTMTRD